jgi:hypothetical protein
VQLIPSFKPFRQTAKASKPATQNKNGRTAHDVLQTANKMGEPPIKILPTIWLKTTQ